MPDTFQYTVNGQLYNVKKEDVENFKTKFPGAVLR